MNYLSPRILLITILILVGCKTTEEIQRDKLVDSMSVQLVEQQKLVAESTLQMQGLEEKIGQMTGQFEETDHERATTVNEEITKIKEQVKVMQEGQQAQSTELGEIQNSLVEQKKYIESVLSTLSKIANKKPRAKSTGKPKSPYNQAMFDYKKAKYKIALPQFETLLSSKKVKGNKEARVFHNMGMIYFMKKDYPSAVTYFSKLLSNHPKAPYNANGLLYLGKSFIGLKQKDQAQQTFETLIASYPKSKYVKSAKKELESIK
jgi:TolA-binding protein